MKKLDSKTYIATEEAYDQICADILKQSTHTLFLLYGEMGAGKTTLTKAFLRALGSKTPVSSPTFSIVNEYLSENGPVYHFDLYRLESQEELINIAIEEYIFSGSICFVEWPQLLAELDIGDYHKIEIEFLDSSQRKISFS